VRRLYHRRCTSEGGVVVGREAEVETRCNSILRVTEDVESGDGMDSLPRVGMWG
jgi:hypothetical protein